VGVARLLRKTLVVIVDEARHKSVGRFDARDALESELFDQPVLQRQMGTFHATLGRRGIGTNPVNIKARKAPA
jgi:hypothetical protein